MKKVLIVGATGQVGRELARAAWPAGLRPVILDRFGLDVTDVARVRAVIAEQAPAVVVNATAYTAVDKAESDAETAFAVNRDGPRALAEGCAAAGAALVHISTDYVFDGRKDGAWVESDPVAPLGVYGASKAAGEQAVREALPEAHVILRTAWVYSPFGGNFVKTMLRVGAERDTLRVVADQHGCPTAAGDIARAIVTLCDGIAAGRRDGFGTFHFAGAGPTTWHAFACAIFDLAARHGRKVPQVEAITTAEYPTPTTRPANSVLDCTAIERTWGIVPRPWRDALAEVIDELLGKEGSAP
ncbi:dTDP-4-dehydrorhamnose reductase [Caenispirillum bisanense]|uniref:dTDP-4-dehydrorhamnose reductase n=1 Tax=Caenispirillum bisanense TaxID=414052 RepID=UPI0031D33E5D